MNKNKKEAFIDRSLRLPIKLLATFKSKSFNGNYFIENLSSGGLFIATDKPLPIGERVKIEFILPHNKNKNTVEATVAWVRKETQGNQLAGMGISFKGLNQEDEELLKKAILIYKGLLDG